MNKISWMIYLGELSSSLSFICGTAGFVFLTVAACKTMRVFYDDLEKGHHATKSAARVFFSFAGRITIPLILIAAILPSKNVVYAIAASEVGEDIVNGPTVTKATKALNVWLDRQIASEKAQ